MANKTTQQDIIHRLKIIEGHLRKIIDMVEKEVYCIDVLQQTSAVRSAIKKAEGILLENHLNNCVVRAIKSNGETKALDELLAVFKKAN
jgi:CsoR family transcriptional regulator, copper-sensing transcriptional repressor